MLRWLILALAVAIFIQPSLAQTPAKPADNSNTTKKPPANCTVSGRVMSAADGTPLRSARVGLIQPNERKHPLVYATTTDDQGRFEIKQIEAGRYNFFASHIGYLEQHYQAKGTNTDEGTVLSLVSGQEVNDALFRLIRAGVITGKVLDDSGEPMMGVNVSVLHKPTDEEREEEGPRGKKLDLSTVSAVQTDDRGEYRIFGLKPGDYFVKAAETGESLSFSAMDEGSDWTVLHELGSQFAPVYYPGVFQMDQAQALSLRAGEEMQADIAMRRMKLTEIAGRVTAPDGSPAVRAFVRLSHAGVSDWGGELGGGTDSKGEFSIKSVPPGSYIIRAGAREKDKFYNTQQKLDVGETKIDSITLALGGGVTIHGRLVTAGGASRQSGRIMVHLQSTSEDGDAGFGFSDVNKDGTFELDGVADGSYALMTHGLEQGWFVKSAHLGSDDVLEKGVQVENGAVKGNLDIVLSSDGAQVEGVITDSDKSDPLAGVQVKARPDPETDFNRSRSTAASTDQNGHYLLKDLPPGKYKVSAKLPVFGTATAPIKSEPVAVTVGEREHRSLDIKLAIPKNE